MVGDVLVISQSPIWWVLATKGLSVGAIVVQWLELFNSLPDEIEYLWKPRVRLVTHLYTWSRYFPLCAQVVNFLLSELIRRPSPTPKLCMTTFVLKAATGQLSTTCMEAILMVRVHALYNQSRSSGIFLLAVMTVGTAFEIAGTSMTMMKLQPGAGGSICIPRRSPQNTLLMFIIGCGINQSTLLIMTLARIVFYKDVTGSWLHRDTPVVSLMLRDGIMVFSLLIAVVALVTVFEFARNETVLVWNAAFSWFVTLISIAGCRVILNMRKLAARPPGPQRHDSCSIFDGDILLSELSYFSGPSEDSQECSIPN